jgi:phosphatidylserine synthase
MFIGFLLVSRVPVYSGKGAGVKVRRDLVMPFILVAVVYVSLLMSFTWETLTLTAIGYLVPCRSAPGHGRRNTGLSRFVRCGKTADGRGGMQSLAGGAG